MKIALRGACESCDVFAGGLYGQLRAGYETCSVLQLPESLGAYKTAHRTARKRAARAQRLGYSYNEVQIEHHSDEIYEINTSRESRQGRPMTKSYLERQEYTPDEEWKCERHRVYRYGVFDARSVLVAYLWLYRSNDLALVSQILGHGVHEQNDTNFLLFQGMIADQIERDLEGVVVYNRHDSGTEGLRYFKEKLGFSPQKIDWQL